MLGNSAKHAVLRAWLARVFCLLVRCYICLRYVFDVFFQAEDGIRGDLVTGVQTCALPIFTSFKDDGSIVTEADFVVQERLSAALQDLYPGSVVLGEEIDRKSVV